MITNKTVLIIGLVWPEPTTTAAGSRMLQLVQLFLKQNYSVLFASTASQNDYSYPLDMLGVKTKKIKVNNDDFNELLKETNPEIVLFDRYITEEQFGWRVSAILPNALKILDTEDLHCVRNARALVLNEKGDFNELLLSSDITKREIASIYRCDLSLIISSYEMELLINTFKIASELLLYVPFLLDLQAIKNNSKSFKQRTGFMTIGNFKHKPNLLAVKELKRSVWPLIRAKLPNAQLNVYGAYMPQHIREMHKPEEGFNVVGWTEDLYEAFSNARICLAPLQFGAGLKGKLVDAMRFGTPSVTTRIGSEGFDRKLPWGGYVASDTDDFVAQAVLLYQDNNYWKNAQQNGFSLLKADFFNKDFGLELIQNIVIIKNKLENHRKSNFIGALLQHHTMKSTAYMSKWITLKNKISADRKD